MAASFLRRAWRGLPMGVRGRLGREVRDFLAPGLAARLPRADPAERRPAEHCVIFGLFSAPIGHGIGAHLLAQELRQAGVETRCIDAADLIGAPQDRAFASAPDDPRAPLIVALNPDVAVHALSQWGPARLRGRRVIGFWVWELDQPPPYWRLARGWVHEIWTPSAYSANAWRVVGAPVLVAPHPAALEAPPEPGPAARARARQRFGWAADEFIAFTSFALSSSLARKNPAAAMAAFARAGAPGRLIVRALFADRYPDAAARLAEGAAEHPCVTLMADPGDREVLSALYAGADAYVSLHRAEGFGLNLAEAMLWGLPVVASAFSGNLEFMSEDSACLIPCSQTRVIDRQGVYVDKTALWAEPDLDAAAQALAALARDRALAGRVGAAARSFALARLGGGAAARALRMTHQAIAP